MRVWRDWALVAVLVPTAILEGIFRPDVVWRPFALVVGVALLFTLLWRRTHALAMVALAFGSTTALTVAAAFDTDEPVGLYTTAFVLLLPYALFRWGAGKEAAIGLAIMVAAWSASVITDFTGVGDAVGGMIFLLFPGALGASLRYQGSARMRELEEVKLREREQLARELHDTVAHHVSAIAVQAQAGRTLAPTQPGAAVDALEVIEEEASRTLTEMRSMVGALRQGTEPDLTPQPGVAEIERLRGAGGSIPIDVELAGDVDDLRPSISSALYRLAQESITNAVRHSRNATRISVLVSGEADWVRLIVQDDGDASPASAESTPGYGVIGMTERAVLLGGTLQAGPSRDRGWTVDAALPRNGSAS